jgi:hypothetical protein
MAAVDPMEALWESLNVGVREWEKETAMFLWKRQQMDAPQALPLTLRQLLRASQSVP